MPSSAEPMERLWTDEDARTLERSSTTGGGSGGGPPRVPGSQTWKIIASMLALAFGGFLIVRSIGAPSAADRTGSLTLIDSATNELFENMSVPDNERMPWTNPRTGQRTLYPVESCYWSAEGKAKLTPTYVFVKEYAGMDEETKCPDCGRRVVPHNPLPPVELLEEAQREAVANPR